jgi:hypothetical protein
MRPALGIALTLLLAASAHAEAISGCEKKDADPINCKDGKPRPMCLQDNIIVFADTRLPVPGGKFSNVGELSLSPCPPENSGH